MSANAGPSQGVEPTEGQLAAIWSEVLGNIPINPDSDFFQLGGDSLQMMIMFFRVNEAFGVEVDPGSIFDNPTLREFGAFIVGARAELGVAAGEQEGII